MADLARALADALVCHYGLPVTALVPLAGGYIHRVFQAQTPAGPVVAKVYQGEDWTPDRLVPVLEAQALAQTCGHPVPAVHRTRDGDWLAPVAGGWVAVMDLAPGRPLPAPELTPAMAHLLGGELARLHRTLAALPPDRAPFIPSQAEAEARCQRLLAAATAAPNPDDAAGALAAAAARLRLDILVEYPIDPSLYDGQVFQVIHGDFYPGNLLFAGERLSAILDWDFCGAGWRGVEVARAAVEVALTAEGGLDLGRVGAFLAGYQETLPLGQAERQGLFRLWLNHLVWNLYPLPLRYQPGAALPQGWEALARRRHAMLTRLYRHLPELEGVLG